jgi:Tfp pilus assembly protein PilE
MALRDDESGLTMVELVIYIVFSAIIAALATSVFINTVIGQSQVTTVTESTTRGQAISQSIERALRNATGATITTDGAGNAVLSVLTTLDQPCQAWRVTPAGEFAAASGNGFPTWGELSDRAEAIDGAPYFSWDGSRVRYSFALTTDGLPVEFSGAIMPRGTGGSVGGACS